jgi:hypothetical protein
LEWGIWIIKFVSHSSRAEKAGFQVVDWKWKISGGGVYSAGPLTG